MEINEFIIVDIETTGLDHKIDLIVEFGIAKVNVKENKVENIFNKIIKENNFCERHKNSWIFKNSDLTYEDVMEKGVNIEEVREEIQNIFNTYPVTSYNKSFDFNFIKYRNFNIYNELACLLESARKIKEISHKMWEVYRYLIDKDFVEDHRGDLDAYREGKIALKLIELGHFTLDIINKGENIND